MRSGIGKGSLGKDYEKSMALQEAEEEGRQEGRGVGWGQEMIDDWLNK